jgi:CRISP-associated protein Cas1
MNDLISSSSLKSILHSKRANIYYLEHARVLVNGGRVEYVTEAGRESKYWNIPIANTTTILLGTGTSVTQAAMRELSRAGVMVGFCGGGGTPLFAIGERTVDIEWISPQSEYRPTEFLQSWVKFWFDDALRLEAAKMLQVLRLGQIEKHWTSRRLREQGFEIAELEIRNAIQKSQSRIPTLPDNMTLLTEEARLSKHLYGLAANAVKYGDFERSKRGESSDRANSFLDHGNYLAYGLAATAAWVLGLPHGLAVLHGKTRRGGLVFDLADLVKDAVVLPLAFICAARGDTEQEFRHACIEALTRAECLDFMIETTKEIALSVAAQVGEKS